MGAPQIVWIALICLTGGLMLEKHGKPREGFHSFGIWSAVVALHASILYWGGFFS